MLPVVAATGGGYSPSPCGWSCVAFLHPQYEFIAYCPHYTG